MSNQIQMIGGPLDGLWVPNYDGYFAEGEILAANTAAFCGTVLPGNAVAGWSPESVYQVKDGKLVYDSAATKERKAVTDADPSQLN